MNGFGMINALVSSHISEVRDQAARCRSARCRSDRSQRGVGHQAAQSQRAARAPRAALRRRIGFALVEAGLRLVATQPPPRD